MNRPTFIAPSPPRAPPPPEATAWRPRPPRRWTAPIGRGPPIRQPAEDGERGRKAMRLSLSIGYSGARLEIPVGLVQRAEELGYSTVWTAEAYGSDAVSPLAYLAAVTKRIGL